MYIHDYLWPRSLDWIKKMQAERHETTVHLMKFVSNTLRPEVVGVFLVIAILWAKNKLRTLIFVQYFQLIAFITTLTKSVYE